MTAVIDGMESALGSDYAPYDDTFTLTADNCIWKYCAPITISGTDYVMVIMGYVSAGTFYLVSGYSDSAYDCSGDQTDIDTVIAEWSYASTDCLWYQSQDMTETVATSTGATATISSDTQSCDACPQCSDGAPDEMQITISTNWSNFFCSNCASLTGTYVLTRRCLCIWVYNFGTSDVCSDSPASEENLPCDRGTTPRLVVSVAQSGSDLVATITYQSVSNGTLGTATVTLSSTHDCNAFSSSSFSLAAGGTACSGFASGTLTAL